MDEVVELPPVEVTETPTVEPQAQEAPTAAGVPDGTVIETPAGEPNEVVVYEYDEAGEVVGWHKEIQA